MTNEHSRQTEEEWKRHWSEVLANARQRPPRFIGPQDRAHIIAIREPLRLVWEAKAFRNPVSASVLRSPHQYIVHCMTGPLLRPIQRTFSFQGARVIGEDWRSDC